MKLKRALLLAVAAMLAAAFGILAQGIAVDTSAAISAGSFVPPVLFTPVTALRASR